MRTSIHAPHAWGDLSLQTCSQGHPTSIHAPHAWGDQNGYICFGSFFDFNPRPICVGRPFVVYIITYTFKLQSTPHMRGATDSASRDFRTSRTSIHAPHAWGDNPDAIRNYKPLPTSIHAPHAWGDPWRHPLLPLSSNFNPRPTCVGRHKVYLEIPFGQGPTSIHAPHAWGDASAVLPVTSSANFNPRPTCVGRQRTLRYLLTGSLLQSTPHMRGATLRNIILTRT